MTEMKERTITELLEEWAELEPERSYLKYQNSRQYVTLACLKKVKGPDGDHFQISLFPRDLSQIELAAIQYAVQEAIEAREGGQFTIGTNPIEGDSHAAWVELGSHDAVEDTGSSPAQALLSAFIAALREVKEDDQAHEVEVLAVP